MKKILFVLLIIPFIAFTQNNKGYFDISKDAYYHERMGSWKKSVYDDSDCKFDTYIDNDSVFSFSAQNYFFREDYILTLNKQKKITKVEIFFTVHNGTLEEWFPYRYPINISDLFKNLGMPDLTKQNISYTPKYDAEVSDYKFKKYYKWNNTLSRETKTEIEVATGVAELPVRDKKGKIKKYRRVNFGYYSQTPKGQGSVTETDINFNTASNISDGAKNCGSKMNAKLYLY